MSQILEFNQLKKDFQKEISNGANENFLARKERSAIDKFIELVDNQSSDDGSIYDFMQIKAVFDPLVMAAWSRFPFKVCFDNYLLYQEADPENVYSDKLYENILKAAIEFGKYYLWLNDILTSSKTVVKNVLTHKQKLIALHYLNLDFNLYENKALAKALSSILQLNQENTRKYLSYVSMGENDVRTKNNLNAVKELFEYSGLNEVADKIKLELKQFD